MAKKVTYAKDDPLRRVYEALTAPEIEWSVVACAEGIWIGNEHWITRDARPESAFVIVMHWSGCDDAARRNVESQLADSRIEFLRGQDFELKHPKDREKKLAKRRAHEKPLDIVYAVVSERYKDVVRRRDTVWVDGMAYVNRDGRSKRVLAHFNEKAPTAWIDKFLSGLAGVGLTFKVGKAFRDSGEGPVEVDQAVEDARWIGRASRSEHVRSCLRCKELLDQCASAEDEYTAEARAAIEKHMKDEPAGTPGVPPCQYSGCVFHDLDVSRELAEALVRVGGGDDPWQDVRGVKVSTIPLIVKKDDHPEAFDMTKQDAVRRRFKDLADSAGDVYVRFGPKKCAVHVWIDPSYASRRESAEDVATIDDVIAQYAKVDKLRDWCMRKFGDLKGLAEMDLQFGRDKEE